MKIMTVIIILITLVLLMIFIFGVFIARNFLPDWRKMEANVLCFVGGEIAAPFIVNPGIFESLVYAGLFTIITVLFSINAKNPIIKIAVPVAVFVVSFVVLYFLAKNFIIPWFGGDDIAFATIITAGLTWLILYPLLNNKKKILIGAILILWLIVFLGYKFGGILLARYAESMGKQSGNKVMEGYPSNCLKELPLLIPTLNEHGQIVNKPLPLNWFSPTWIIGSIVAFFGLILFIVSVIKIKKGEKR